MIQSEFLIQLPAPKKPRARHPAELKVITLRDCPMTNPICDQPHLVNSYWREHIQNHPYFNQHIECCVVMMLNTRRRLMGHSFVSTGTLDTILVHPREIFRPAIAMAAAGIIVAHNHPSGDATPSDADIKVTRDLIKAGQLLKIEILDHVIVGRPNIAIDANCVQSKGWSSLRELGYFYC